jgi:hypothetical protein
MTGENKEDRKDQRTRIVVLGSGWGACSFLKALNKHDAEVLGLFEFDI